MTGVAFIALIVAFFAASIAYYRDAVRHRACRQVLRGSSSDLRDGVYGIEPLDVMGSRSTYGAAASGLDPHASPASARWQGLALDRTLGLPNSLAPKGPM